PDDIGCNQQVVVQKVRMETVIGQNAADACRGHNHDVGSLGAHETLNLSLTPQIEPVAAYSDKGAVLIRQSAHHSAPDHAPVPGDEYPLARQCTHGSSAFHRQTVAGGADVSPHH